VKISDKLIDGIGADAPAKDGSAFESAFDIEYKESNKKHRNVLSNLDHWYKVISHKFTIFIIFIVVLLVFLTTRYLGAVLDSEVILRISRDAGTALTYIITIIGTSVFTKFLEKDDKN
jgi:hypothetical protein